MLYLIEILHQTTTSPILSFLRSPVVSYRNSTSNHNLSSVVLTVTGLYLIEILHQTTTVLQNAPMSPLVVSYRNSTSNHNKSLVHGIAGVVVSYRNSTSNHNYDGVEVLESELYLIEILHQTTTAHKALWDDLTLYLIEILHQTTTYNLGGVATAPVVSYRNSTSNHNPTFFGGTVEIVVSYRNSTSNHNPPLRYWGARTSCILSKFYIKPQLGRL